MKSMTGYGRGSATGDDFSVSVDLKTVNNRFLDVHLRLGGELSPLEGQIKRRITSRLSRGRVDVTVTFERTSPFTYELNRPLITGYVNALREMQKEFGVTGELDINVLARLPGALQSARDGVSEAMIDGIERALDEALRELEKMRAQEGETLRKEMSERVDTIEALVPVIEAAASGLVETYRQRLQKRIGELFNRESQLVELDPSRMAQEVAYLADRSDVSEEMVRLRSHLTQFREALAAAHHVWEVMDEHAEIPVKENATELPPLKHAIELKDVSFDYADETRPVLHNVNLTIPAGTMVALVGESGGGKSTLTKLLPRFHDPASGLP